MRAVTYECGVDWDAARSRQQGCGTGVTYECGVDRDARHGRLGACFERAVGLEHVQRRVARHKVMVDVVDPLRAQLTNANEGERGRMNG